MRRFVLFAQGRFELYDTTQATSEDPAMIMPDYLTEDEHGYIHVTGHRVGLQDVIYYYNEGYSPEGLLEAFPTLTLSIVHKVIAFYLDHKTEVDVYAANSDAEVARQRATAPRGPDSVELRRRLAMRQSAGA